MTTELGTTNLLLGIMAAVSVLEALALIGGGVMAYRMYTRAMTAIQDLEHRHVAPLTARVNEVLADVKTITARVSTETERVDHAIRGTIDRVDETAERVRTNVSQKVGHVIHLVRVARDVIESVLNGRAQRA